MKCKFAFFPSVLIGAPSVADLFPALLYISLPACDGNDGQ
jgi:hypothetical protein